MIELLGKNRFLGTQGDSWDTQSDMLFALIGAVCMVVFISGIQDKYIKRMDASDNHDSKTKQD